MASAARENAAMIRKLLKETNAAAIKIRNVVVRKSAVGTRKKSLQKNAAPASAEAVNNTNK